MPTASGAPSETIQYLVVSFLAIAAYNVLELLFWIFDFFNKHSGLYFWSILLGTVCTGIYMIFGTLFQFCKSSLQVIEIALGLSLVVILTAQSLVLYSRLHLLTNGPIVTYIFWVIIVTTIGLCVPSIIIIIGHAVGAPWSRHLYIIERAGVVPIIAREFSICSIYIYQALRQLKPIIAVKGRAGRKVIIHLVFVNITVILLEVFPLFLLWTGGWDVRVRLSPVYLPYRAVAFSIKFKLEFSVLNKLRQLLGAPMGSIAVEGIGQSTTSESRQRMTRTSQSNNDNGAWDVHRQGLPSGA